MRVHRLHIRPCKVAPGFKNLIEFTITFDQDSGELIFKYGFRPKAGVIYSRWTDFRPNEPGMFLKELFTEKKIEFRSCIFICGDEKTKGRHHGKNTIEGWNIDSGFAFYVSKFVFW